MAYIKNGWAIFNPDLPEEEQEDAFITLAKMQNIEDGIEAAHNLAELGSPDTVTTAITMGTCECGDVPSATIEDYKLNLVLPKGDPGVTGPVGPAGKDGAQGPQGEVGPQGPQGIQGEKGPQGDPGPQGIQGIQGIQGPQGETGPQGPAGIDGKDGAQGPQGEIGPQGPEGPQGPAGAKGEQGIQGPQGEIGPQGPAGADGAPGIQGPQGLQGIQGEKGETGPQGPQGETGATGATGAQGPKGDKGDTGEVGPQGETGPQGPQGVAGIGVASITGVKQADGAIKFTFTMTDESVKNIVVIIPAEADATVISVATEAALEAAMADENITTIELNGNMEVTKALSFNKEVTINGNGGTVSTGNTGKVFTVLKNSTVEDIEIVSTADNAVWHSSYNFHFYTGTHTVKNVKVSGGNAGILINGATVNLEGIIDVSGNFYGGIEVSKGSNPELTPSVLNIGSATLVNTTEAYGQPTIWVDGNTDDVGVVNGAENLFMIEITKDNGITQRQYYINEANTVAPTV